MIWDEAAGPALDLVAYATPQEVAGQDAHREEEAVAAGAIRPFEKIALGGPQIALEIVFERRDVGPGPFGASNTAERVVEIFEQPDAWPEVGVTLHPNRRKSEFRNQDSKALEPPRATEPEDGVPAVRRVADAVRRTQEQRAAEPGPAAQDARCP